MVIKANSPLEFEKERLSTKNGLKSSKAWLKKFGHMDLKAMKENIQRTVKDLPTTGDYHAQAISQARDHHKDIMDTMKQAPAMMMGTPKPSMPQGKTGAIDDSTTETKLGPDDNKVPDSRNDHMQGSDNPLEDLLDKSHIGYIGEPVEPRDDDLYSKVKNLHAVIKQHDMLRPKTSLERQRKRMDDSASKAKSSPSLNNQLMAKRHATDYYSQVHAERDNPKSEHYKDNPLYKLRSGRWHKKSSGVSKQATEVAVGRENNDETIAEEKAPNNVSQLNDLMNSTGTFENFLKYMTKKYSVPQGPHQDSPIRYKAGSITRINKDLRRLYKAAKALTKERLSEVSPRVPPYPGAEFDPATKRWHGKGSSQWLGAKRGPSVNPQKKGSAYTP